MQGATVLPLRWHRSSHQGRRLQAQRVFRDRPVLAERFVQLVKHTVSAPHWRYPEPESVRSRLL
eukprot:4579774-Amphidinium_carterae.1